MSIILTAAQLLTAGAVCIPPRDAHGRIARSASARGEFVRANPCPVPSARVGVCQGYVVDHIVPLKRCGADRPDNMQWQTRAAARVKDRTE